MGNSIIRVGTPGDAPRITELMAQWGYAAEAGAVRRRLERWTDGLFVAEVDGEVEGLVAITSFPVFEVDASLGRIVALVVSDRCRGAGIGRKLVAQAERAARDAGCVGVEVTSSRRRTAAHAFYRALDYVERCELKGHFTKEF